MRIPEFLRLRLTDVAIYRAMHVAPDFVIGGEDNPYLRRWFLTPWSRYERGTRPANLWQWIKRHLPNVYVHEFLRSDDDRALHDHPWFNASILLLGTYVEHTIAAGGINHARRRQAGEVKLRSPWSAHRIEVAAPCFTLFITGPVMRDWGFHCPQGWRFWKDFVAQDPGQVGRGCE
jgi:hypothetical protein